MNHDKSQRTPIIEPLLLMLKSRRTLIALATAITGVLVMLLPTLEPVQTELLTLLITLALALIGGYSAEDAARAARERTPDDLEARILRAVKAALEEQTNKS